MSQSQLGPLSCNQIVILSHLSFPPLLSGKPHYFEYLGATASNDTASIRAKPDSPKIDKSANFTHSIFLMRGLEYLNLDKGASIKHVRKNFWGPSPLVRNTVCPQIWLIFLVFFRIFPRFSNFFRKKSYHPMRLIELLILVPHMPT